MTIKKRLSIICLIFGIIPLIIMYLLGVKSGLLGNGAFENAVALALMSALLLGLFSSGIVRYWLLGRQLEKIQKFCLAVKDGSYHVFLPVPNESSDIEDENEMVELMRNMNWMAHHIKLNEENLQQIVRDLKASQEKIQSQKDELEYKTDQLTAVVNKIRNLLDHAGQGFVSFTQDLTVENEYSAECLTLFRRDITGENIGTLLFPQDQKQQKFMTALLQKIFQVEDDFLRENYVSLLPQEIAIDEKYLQIDYKFIHHPTKEKQQEIMLILTDVTKQRVMEEKIQEEKDILAMVVNVVTEKKVFSDAVQGYTHFCQKEIVRILESISSVEEKLSTLFRIVHTWKGTFGQFNMQYLVKKLHQLEGMLGELREKQDIELLTLEEHLNDYSSDTMYSWLVHEVDILQSILGKEFLMGQEIVSIEKTKLVAMGEKVKQLPDSPQKQELVLELERFHYKPFRELLHSYPTYTMSLAKRYEKQVQAFEIEGGEVLVNPKKYQEFSQTLVHVFRNAVAHGLENVEERIEAGKEEMGTILCKVETDGRNMVLLVQDDGCGIAGDRMKEIGVDKGIITQETAACLSDEEAIQLIFAEGFSSSQCTDEISGRGVGLYAVRKEVEKLGGNITVRSQVGIGTEFRFALPL